MSEEENKTNEYGNYRKFGQPTDTVSGATREMFEVRSAKASAQGEGGAGSTSTSLAFKIIAAIGIVLLIAAIIASQVGAW